MGPIVGIGELLWDIYPDGHKVAGGAPFNFAFHCYQLGHEAVIVSRVGDDDLGKELREEVKRLGMKDYFITTDYNHPTGTVQVTVDDKELPSYRIAENVAWDYIGEEANLSLDGCIDEEGFRHDVVAIYDRDRLARRSQRFMVNDSTLLRGWTRHTESIANL